MSEYQYYEFLAIDRLLTAEEITALRELSTRAHITPGRVPLPCGMGSSGQLFDQELMSLFAFTLGKSLIHCHYEKKLIPQESL